MIYSLLILLISALLTHIAGWKQRYAGLGRFIAVPGAIVALLVALFTEGLPDGGAAGRVVEWPAFLAWLGRPIYESDALSARLGAWCLLLGALYLWRVAGGQASVVRDQRSDVRDRRSRAGDRRSGTIGQGPKIGDRRSERRSETVDRRSRARGRRSLISGWQLGADAWRSIWRLVIGTLVIAVLYSLVHTWDLRVFAAQMLLLVMLAWALSDEVLTSNPRYSLLTMSAGAACLMGAALLIGRAMGGEYSLGAMSPSALTRWPLALIAIGSVLWLGLAPLTGWSLRGFSGAPGALAQSLIVGVPVITLLVRLQSVMTTQGQAVGDWEIFMVTLTWIGGLSAVIAAACTIVAAGTARWESLLGAYTMGLVACAVGLDTALGRYAALIILLAFGAARMTLELARGVELPLPATTGLRWTIVIVCFSLAAIPLTIGFVGIWLLATALMQLGHASVTIALVGAFVMSACGVALHYAYGGFSPGQASGEKVQRAALSTIFSVNTDGSLRLAVSLTGGLALVAGGITPRLWLPQVAAMASVVSNAAPVNLTPMGLEIRGELPIAEPALASVPVLLLAIATLGLAGVGWFLVFWMRSGLYSSGVLRPTAAKRLQKLNDAVEPSETVVQPLPAARPARWLSLLGLEDGFRRDGVILLKLGARAGAILGRLEGRYYMPLALVLVLMALMAITR